VTTDEPAILEKVAVKDGMFNALPDIWQSCSDQFGDAEAIYDPHRSPPVRLTYSELREEIVKMAYALQSLGLKSGQCVALFAESSSRWIIADQAIMMNAAIDAVRGASAPLIELQQIVLNSGSVGLVLQDENALEALTRERVASLPGSEDGIKEQQEQFRKVIESKIQFAVLLWDDLTMDTTELNFPVYTYSQLISLGQKIKSQDLGPFPESKPDDTATIVYTSGTSGSPKGVELTHQNIIYQFNICKNILAFKPGDHVLSFLPPWHIYERAVAYYNFSRGCRIVYSSVKTLKNDMVDFPTVAFITVPLVLGSLHKRIFSRLHKAPLVKKVVALTLLRASMAFTAACRVVNGLDIRFARTPRPFLEFIKALLMSWILLPLHMLARLLIYKNIRTALGIERIVISGGGSLVGHLDLFFEAVGLPVLNGWGLTETSPVLCCRLPSEDQNIRGTVGVPVPGTEIKVVDPETFKQVDDGVAGLVLARGPGVMKGYHNNPEATSWAIDSDGWFNTGDRGWRAPSGVKGSKMAGHLVLTGRLKDTIVLSSGENVEPQLIEDWLQASPLISHIMVIGQDHRALGALVTPDEEHLQEDDPTIVHDKILNEIWKLERQNPNFVQHMHISAIQVLKYPFSVEDGTLTKTMKIRREAILEEYAKDVDDLQKRIR